MYIVILTVKCVVHKTICSHYCVVQLDNDNIVSYYTSLVRAPEAYGTQFVHVSVCMSITRVCQRPLQARHWQVQCRHNVTISQI